MSRPEINFRAFPAQLIVSEFFDLMRNDAVRILSPSPSYVFDFVRTYGSGAGMSIFPSRLMFAMIRLRYEIAVFTFSICSAIGLKIDFAADIGVRGGGFTPNSLATFF